MAETIKLIRMERIEKLKSYLSENPQDSFLQHALALEYIKIGEDEKARELFTALLNHDENYVGSYYHLGKLLERMNESEQALKVYRKGMEKAKAAGDNHAYNELRGAEEELEY